MLLGAPDGCVEYPAFGPSSAVHAAGDYGRCPEISADEGVGMHSYASAQPSSTPRADESFSLADGRRLAYAEWGPKDGAPLVFFHGTPGSRLFCPDERSTTERGVRFVSFDRAGYGRSDLAPPLIGFPSFVPDVIELLDHLAIERAVLVGWSGGGPHALAVAAAEPQRVVSVGLASSGVMNSRDRAAWLEAAGGPPEVMALIEEIAEDPVGRRELARVRCQWLLDDPTEIVRLIERYAPEALAAQGLLAAMETLWLEAGRPGIEGYINDYVTQYATDFGYELSAVRVPATIWYGERDVNVSPEESRSTAAQIPGCRLVGCAECGHLTPIAHWSEMLDTLL